MLVRKIPHNYNINYCIKSIIFDGDNIQIELKDTFKALQNVNETAKNIHRNNNLRTPEKPSIITKKTFQKRLL